MSEEIKGWKPIDSAPNDTLVIVGWIDVDDHDNPERYDFDFKEDGVWVKHEELYQHFCFAAPPGSSGPKETAPYTHWMMLKPIAESIAAAPEPSASASQQELLATTSVGMEPVGRVECAGESWIRGKLNARGRQLKNGTLLQTAEQLATLQAKLDSVAAALGVAPEMWRIATCNQLEHQIKDVVRNSTTFFNQTIELQAKLEQAEKDMAELLQCAKNWLACNCAECLAGLEEAIAKYEQSSTTQEVKK